MVRFYLSGNPVHDRVITAMYEGCPIEKVLVNDWTWEPSDVAVIFGVYKSKVPLSIPRGRIFRQQREKNLNVLVLETGYINRGDGEAHHYAAGFNGLNGRADFRNKGMPDDRAILLRRYHGLRCLDWRKTGSHVLLCGQVPWDASVDHINYIEWLLETAAALKTRKWEVRYRPHPLGPKQQISGCSYSTAPLMEDLADAWATVAFNSNAVVESIIEGVPGFSFDEGSMANGVCNVSLDALDDPVMPDRHPWLNDLAYAQWTPEEMRRGLAWKHLFR